MKTNAYFIACSLLLLALLGGSKANAQKPNPNPEDAALNSTISKMEARHQGAFVSACVAKSPSATFLATVIYFPRPNSGMFVLRETDGHVSNSGGVWIDDKGRWELSDLEGGMDTVRILNDLFFKLVRLKFTWVAPSDLGHIDKLRAQNTCRMLGG